MLKNLLNSSKMQGYYNTQKIVRKRALKCIQLPIRISNSLLFDSKMSEEREEKPVTLEISVKLPSGEPVKLKVRKETKMDKVFVAIAKQLGVEKNSLRFHFDGNRINGEQTPKMLEMEDGDQIDCVPSFPIGDEKADMLEISINIPSGEPVKLKVRKETMMDKIFVAIAKQLGVEKNALRFFLDGHRINGEQTPKMLEMEDGDQIDCVVYQEGGVSDDINTQTGDN